VKVLVFIIGIVTTLAAAWNIFGKSDWKEKLTLKDYTANKLRSNIFYNKNT
jgi:hypothetical protein